MITLNGMQNYKPDWKKVWEKITTNIIEQTTSVHKERANRNQISAHKKTARENLAKMCRKQLQRVMVLLIKRWRYF